MKRIIVLFFIVLLASCKTKKALLESASATGKATADSIIKRHYNNKVDFSTLYIKANAKYKDKKQSQSVTAEIRIKNNEKILVSVRFLGITMAKGLITPNQVKYYEKIGNTYFEGDYAALSRWLGTDLDYNKVQNMLLGYAFDDLNLSKYEVSIVENFFKLTDKNKAKTEKNYYFEAQNFALKKQEFIQEIENRKMQVNYKDYQKVSNTFFPLNYSIDASNDKDNTVIEIEYKTIDLNQEMTFPFSIPEGYHKIEIEK